MSVSSAGSKSTYAHAASAVEMFHPGHALEMFFVWGRSITVRLRPRNVLEMYLSICTSKCSYVQSFEKYPLDLFRARVRNVPGPMGKQFRYTAYSMQGHKLSTFWSLTLRGWGMPEVHFEFVHIPTHSTLVLY